MYQLVLSLSPIKIKKNYVKFRKVFGTLGFCYASKKSYSIFLPFIKVVKITPFHCKL